MIPPDLLDAEAMRVMSWMAPNPLNS